MMRSVAVRVMTRIVGRPTTLLLVGIVAKVPGKLTL